MKIRIFKTRERSTAPVWEVTEGNTTRLYQPEGGEDMTLDSAIASFGSDIVSYHFAATTETPGNSFLYHSFLLK